MKKEHHHAQRTNQGRSGRLLRSPLRSERRMVGVEGFEPPTYSSQSCRAARLRYTPIRNRGWRVALRFVVLKPKSVLYSGRYGPCLSGPSLLLDLWHRATAFAVARGGCICGRHKLAVELPAGGDGIQRAPDAHPQPRKESGLKCRGFDALGTANRYALNVRLHLHEEVALRGPSQLSAMLQGTSGLVDRGSKI